MSILGDLFSVDQYVPRIFLVEKGPANNGMPGNLLFVGKKVIFLI